MSLELIQPFKDARTLIKFTYGITVIPVTTWKTPIEFGGLRYESEPGIATELPTQTGGLNEDPLKIDLPLTRSKVNSKLQSLAAQIASTRAFPRLRVEVMQLITVGQSQKPYHLYEGTMERSRTNPEGRAGIVSLEFASELRYGLDRISLGRRSDPECDLIFGSNGCEHPASRARMIFEQTTYHPNHVPTSINTVRSAWVTVTISSASSRQVSLELESAAHPTPSPAPPDPEWRVKTLSEMPEGYWIGSFLEDYSLTKLKIPIQTWYAGSNSFTLAQTPPASWNGSAKLLQVGCPRTVGGCADRFNSRRFGGLGYGTPAYNPTLEVSQ